MCDDNNGDELIPSKTDVLGLPFNNKLGNLKIDSDGCWSKLEAQTNYLESPPTTFIILCKPGLNEKFLGDKIAENWNCMHVDPDEVIQEQINLRSDTGRCLEFNLKCGNVVTADIILKIIEKILQSEVIKHRGYVISGLPLVETYKSNDCCNTLYSEEAFCTVEDILVNLIMVIDLGEATKSYIGELSERESENAEFISNLESPTGIVINSNIDDVIDFRTKLSGIVLSGIVIPEAREYCRKISLKDQINFIASLKPNPTVLINISCPNEDVVFLRAQHFFGFPSCEILSTPFKSDSYENVSETNRNNKSFEIVSTYQCWRPFNFPNFVESQLKKFTRNSKSLMKQYILRYNPEYVITLDGRRSAVTNLNIIKTKLSQLPLFRVILPTVLKCINVNDPELENIRNSESLSSEEFLDNIEYKLKLDPQFPYSESLWRTKCPVALSEGKAVLGLPKFAVILFDHVYLLSTIDALKTFCINPRPYLKEEYLTPTCRIAIVGTTKSGKSTLAKCLSWILNGALIDFNRIHRKLLSEKESVIQQKHYAEASVYLMQVRQEVWIKKENARVKALEEWKQERLNVVEKYAEIDESEIHELLLSFKQSSKSTPVSSRRTSKKSSSIRYSSSVRRTSTREPSAKGTPSMIPALTSSTSAIKQLKRTTQRPASASVATENRRQTSSSYTRPPSTASSLSKKRSSASFLSTAVVSSVGILKWIVNKVFGGVVDESVFIGFCQNVITEPDTLLKYAPLLLKNPCIQELPSHEEILKRANEVISGEDAFADATVTDEEIIDILLTKIKNIDKNTKKKGPKTYGKWIIDGMPCQLKYWDALAEHNCLPDDVFILRENENIDLETFLRHKTRRRNETSLNSIFDQMNEPLLELRQSSLQLRNKSSVISEISRMVTTLLEKDYFEDNKLRHVPCEITAESLQAFKTSEFDDFLNNINQFNEDYSILKSLIEGFMISPFEIIIPSTWSPSELISETLKLLRYRYGVNCKKNVSKNNTIVEVQSENEVNDMKFFGVCGPYCPVTFYKHSVLWKGKEEFALRYKQKSFYMSSLDAQNEFLSDPEHFIFSEIPIDPIPPWRICITGPIGSGRTTISKLLAEQLGLIYVNFCNFAFSCLLLCPRDRSRNFYNWLNEPEITNTLNESILMQSDSDLEIIDQMKNYFIDQTNLLPTNILNSILSKLWFTEPFCKTGIVIDGFPCHPAELDILKEHFYLPDVILELRTSYKEVFSRMFRLNCSIWKNQQAAYKEQYEIERRNRIAVWQSRRSALFTAYSIYLEIEHFVFITIDSHHGSEAEDPITTYKTNSFIWDKLPSNTALHPSDDFQRSDSNLSIKTRSVFSDSTLSSRLPLFEISDEGIEFMVFQVDGALPVPVFNNDWETEESAHERIKTRIEVWYLSDMEMLSSLRELCENELLPWITVDSLRKNERTLKIIHRFISEMKCRNESFFENTLLIDEELAELLLSNGFYFLSKFGVTCPVRVFEDDDTLVQIYLHNKFMKNIYPVLHRSFIYFCSGNENFVKFCENPLKFTYSSKIDNVIHIPIRLAITGPPKCGKTTLSHRFQEEFGFRILTSEQSICCVVEDFSWTFLAREIQNVLSQGETVPCELVMKAIKLASTDSKSLLQGFICDGCPQKTGCTVFLVESEIFPFMILSLECSMDVCFEYLHTTPEYIKNMPRISIPFLSHMYNTWSQKHSFFLMSVRQCYQNLESLDASWSKWHCWWEAKNYFSKYVADISRFLANVSATVIPMDRLCITQEEFYKHCSQVRDYCPQCLLNGILTRSGQIFNRIGLVQWTKIFYWICHEHYEEFLISPYIVEQSLPVNLPERRYDFHSKDFYENGRCIVTFSDNFPTRTIVNGSMEFAAEYMNVTYLFSDKKSLDKFMAVPKKYYDKKIHFETDNPLPVLEVSQLPVLGYLEQCLSDIVIKASGYVAKVRPKYPGLSASVSAAILFGLFLKCNNPKVSPNNLETYSKVMEDFEKRCTVVKETLDFMRSHKNPFIEKPVCCGMSDTYSVFSSMSGESSTLSVRYFSADEFNTSPPKLLPED